MSPQKALPSVKTFSYSVLFALLLLLGKSGLQTRHFRTAKNPTLSAPPLLFAFVVASGL
jgi:hypothetical protein